MNVSKIGLALLVTGISAALVGTWFYQSALSGVITQIELGNLVEVTTIYLPNMQYMAIMTMFGVLLTIIGVGFAFSNKED